MYWACSARSYLQIQIENLMPRELLIDHGKADIPQNAVSVRHSLMTNQAFSIFPGPFPSGA